MDEEGARPRPTRLRTARLEAFSDGVFAIAITLLVLDIAVPAGSEHHLLRAFVDQWPEYLAYLVSFATIGAIWVGHTVVTEYLDHADPVLIRLNLVLLLLVSFLPFPTRLLADYVNADEDERVATTIYGLTLLACVAMLAGVWRYARRAGLVRPDAADHEVQALTERLTPGLAGYVALIALGLFLPVVAVIGYLVIALFVLYPFRGLTPRRSR